MRAAVSRVLGDRALPDADVMLPVDERARLAQRLLDLGYPEETAERMVSSVEWARNTDEQLGYVARENGATWVTRRLRSDTALQVAATADVARTLRAIRNWIAVGVVLLAVLVLVVARAAL